MSCFEKPTESNTRCERVVDARASVDALRGVMRALNAERSRPCERGA